ncbi:N-acyl homoserine lactonase family protein [Paractinoplanes hotanensis]|uniref:N-acyl homoserine lactonase family protein n=1 Tax=Paractinoplanes hotanensis TaxID=2906497 RepID=A0ABT0YE31_9ACTN|nr:N-acyl homoserine lactonase family protein [Actinoplanes hotanensis]MCM4084299.1 N-acyl homoserine lactonase family protein [Actinoplanes hotanensis]
MFVIPLGVCGCRTDLAAPGAGGRVDLPVLAYLLRLDDGRNVMVDTGMSRLHVNDPLVTWRGTALADVLTPSMAPDDDLEHQLRLLDLGPDDIDFVVNTHLHFDHAGNNDLFTRATFLVQREHYAAALGNPAFPNRYWNLPGLRFELLDGDGPIFPGVEVVATPGHAPGHQSVVVRLPESGTFIICGDALHSQAGIDQGSWTAQADPVAARASGRRLVELAEAESAILLFAHDTQQAAGLVRSPHGYR